MFAELPVPTMVPTMVHPDTPAGDSFKKIVLMILNLRFILLYMHVQLIVHALLHAGALLLYSCCSLV